MAIGITNHYNSFFYPSQIKTRTNGCLKNPAVNGREQTAADCSGYAANGTVPFSSDAPDHSAAKSAVSSAPGYPAQTAVKAAAPFSDDISHSAAGSTSETIPASSLNPFNPNRAESLRQYAARLAKLAPSVKFRIGTTFCKDRSGKTLTINPGLLVKMQNDPQQEQDTMDMIKGVEFITRWMDSIYKSTGKTLVYRHSYIDSDGRYYAFSYVRDDHSLKMSAAMRKERQQNSQKLIQKTREKALKQKKGIQKKLKKTVKSSTKTWPAAGAAVDIRL